jgi:membrane protein YqaA with SNARE-associated domain
LFTHLKKLYEWLGKQAYSPYADLLLGFIFYVEAIFFFPTDPILILYCLERRDRALRYATIATIGSVLGGLTSYGIGYYIWHVAGDAIIHQSFLNRFIKPDTFLDLCNQYRAYESWAILIAGFSFIVPYKAVTFTAGFCQLSVPPFIFYSCIVRGFRFYLVAILIKIWGTQIQEFIDRYFKLLVALVMLVVGIIILFMRLSYQ